MGTEREMRREPPVTPATDEEIEEVLRESGVSSLDEIPNDAIVTEGWGEFIDELDRGQRQSPSREG